MKILSAFFQFASTAAFIFLAAPALGQTGADQQRECSSMTSCQNCIRASPKCAWCADPDHPMKSPRCFAASVQNGCSNNNLVENPQGSITGQSQETFEGLNQITPLQTNITLRINKPQSFDLKVQPSNNYPIDLYLLMDLSYSMKDDLAKLKTLGSQLSTRIGSISTNFKLGFGSFVDKKLAPFVDLDPNRLSDPCYPDGCQSPYSYHHIVNLTEDNSLFQRRVDEQVISGNRDIPEGGFEGFLQAVVCPKLVGWRTVSRKLLLYLTDASFHIAGDGRLAGVVKPNDGKCHMDDLKIDPLTGNVVYQEWKVMDYPSIGQIGEKLDEFDVIPIFAVVTNAGNTYEQLVQELGDRAYVGLLAADSSNVVDLVEDLYNKISQRIVFAPERVPGLTIKVKTKSCPGTLNDEGICTGVTIGQVADFQVTVTVTECTEELASGPRLVPVRVLGFGTFHILVDPICSCDCDAEENIVENSTRCSEQGDLACGVCKCYRGFFGEICQCNATGLQNGNDLDCPTGIQNKECSGRGLCTCGICKCRTESNDEERFYGPACECDKSICENEGKVCSGPNNGECTCDGCRCLNEPVTGLPFNGTFCDCSPNTQTCTDPSNSTDICNGKGWCGCGKCNCFAPYFGTYCELCSGTKACKLATCDYNGPNGVCAECVVNLLEVFNQNNVSLAQLFTEEYIEAAIQNGTLPSGTTLDQENLLIHLPESFAENCNSTCTHLVINHQTMLVDYEINGVVSTRCQYDPLECDYRYYVAINRTDSTRLPIHVEYPPVCPTKSRSRKAVPLAIPPWAIALILLLILLLLGILALVLLKLLLMLLDWIEVRKFEQELGKSNYPKHTNPLFRSPQKEYKNPIYGK